MLFDFRDLLGLPRLFKTSDRLKEGFFRPIYGSREIQGRIHVIIGGSAHITLSELAFAHHKGGLRPFLQRHLVVVPDSLEGGHG
ncbi:uncharacterized protein METZ01_LOCUS252731, partial [marine metagenome]